MSDRAPSNAELVRWAQPTARGGFPEEASRLLAALGTVFLSDPTEKTLETLSGCSDPPVPQPFREALEDLARAAASSETVPARVEYTRLFYHPLGAVCPPWECTELDESPQLMGPRHHELLRWFRRAGVEPQREGGESVDHVGYELTFLALLAARTGSGDDQSQMFADFWSAHVEPWMAAFAQRLIDCARTDLYTSAGRLLLCAVSTTRSAEQTESTRFRFNGNLVGTALCDGPDR